MAILEAENIGKRFGGAQVLRDIGFSLEKDEVLSIIGSSGSGKTTLLRCLNFLERPDTGVIRVKGETLFDAADRRTLRESSIRKNRLHFGLVFQNFNLFPHMSVIETASDGEEALRILSRQPVQPDAAMTDTPSRTRTDHTLLVVDDNEELLLLISNLLAPYFRIVHYSIKCIGSAAHHHIP